MVTPNIELFTTLSLKVYEDVKKLHQQLLYPVNSIKLKKIFADLDSSSSRLESLKETLGKTSSLFLKARLDYICELQQQIISLYGKALDKHVDFQIQQIFTQSEELYQEIIDVEAQGIEGKIQQLQRLVYQILSQHRLSKDHRQIVDNAKDIVYAAKAKQIALSLLNPKDKLKKS
ncbi:MAG: hypothetical protein EBZ47_03715 [Chlamydiae bacterium]|nr:hypothetical protein [Chlamydiota bacterium]